MRIHNVGLRRPKHLMCFATRSCFDYHRFTSNRL